MSEQRDGGAMNFDTLMVSVEHHCRIMGPVATALTSSEDEVVGGLARLLDHNDRKLDRLCHQLRQQVGHRDDLESD